MGYSAPALSLALRLMRLAGGAGDLVHRASAAKAPLSDAHRNPAGDGYGQWIAEHVDLFPNTVLREATAHAVLAIKALRAMLDDMPRAAPIMLASATGKAWKKRYFSDQSKKVSDRAGLIDLHFHDLRGTAVTMLAEAGCTIPEIAAITGHSLKTVNTILEKYLSRMRTLAEVAMEKFENAPTTNFASRVQSEVVKTD